MKRLLVLVLCLAGVRSVVAGYSCPDPQTIDRLQQLQRDVDTIRAKVCNIQLNIEINESLIENINISAIEGACSGIEELSEQISLVEANLCSKIENIDISSIESACSGIEELSEQISLVEVNLCSKIDNINVSTSEAVCSGIDELSEQLSITDAMLCSKIGNLDDTGSCLGGAITVPQDIDNLELSTIALLKTILLDLRGCGAV